MTPSDPNRAEAPSRPAPRRLYLGWWMTALAFLLYGFGMAPAYYGWGFLAPEVIDELGLTREQVGHTFGLFTLTFALTSPVAAAAITRFGIRPVVAVGSLVGALGFAWTSVARSADELVASYALVGGVGIGLTTLLPAQLLPARWFRRYRARATAIVLSGAAVVGAFFPAIANEIAATWDWRMVWRVVAATTLAVGALAAVFLRDHPRDVGLRPDGDEHPGPAEPERAAPAEPGEPAPSTIALLSSPRFLLVTFACLANAIPWRVVTAHGRIHLEDLGFAASVAAAILGFRVGLSAAGRLGGSVGDFFDPRRVLAVALLASALGLAGFAAARSELVAYASIGLLGLGYGVGFTSEPVVVARVLGTRAFLSANGVRLGLTGVVGWLGPRWTGAAADASGAYDQAFAVLAALCVAGAVVVSFCRPAPGEVTGADRSATGGRLG